MFKTKLGKPAARESTAASAPVDRKEQKRQEAEARQRLSAQRKPIETRIKRLEEQMARHNTRRAELETLLTDPALYTETQKDALKTHLFEQASLAKGLEQLEAEWLERQETLESIGG